MALSPLMRFERDPFSALRRLQDEIERGFAGPGRVAQGFPAINLWQGPDSAALTAELPGVQAADLEISVKDDVVTLSGERKAPAVGEQGAWHRRERSYGRFSRLIELPFRVDPDRVEARLQDGVLQIELHRPETDKPRRITISSL